MVAVRPFKDEDWTAVWQMMGPVFRAGETYAFATDMTETEARRIWVDLPGATFVAVGDGGEILGTYYVKANSAGPGDHVCNCGYIVGDAARGKGVASEMCRHSQQEAVARGFRAMQFNSVVSTNEGAIRLWKKLGFEVVGTLPEAYRHSRLGFVDAFVMYKKLTP